MRLTRAFTGAVAIVALVAVACGDSGDGTSTTSALEHGSSRNGPSRAAREICEPMIRDAVEFEVGSPLLGDPVPSVSGDTFSCRYEFEGGTLGMSVRDLKRRGPARAYFDELLDVGGTVERLPGLGEESFLRPDGTLVLIKDAMVLTIDVTALPPLPADGPDKPTISTDLGAAVMGCWPG